MAKYVDFPFESGEKIRVEVVAAEEPTGAVRGNQSVPAVVENAQIAFEQALSKLKPMCAAIVRQVRDALEQPEEIAVEFGIKLSAEAGIEDRETAMRFLGWECERHWIHTRIAARSWDTFDQETAGPSEPLLP